MPLLHDKYNFNYVGHVNIQQSLWMNIYILHNIFKWPYLLFLFIKYVSGQTYSIWELVVYFFFLEEYGHNWAKKFSNFILSIFIQIALLIFFPICVNLNPCCTVTNVSILCCVNMACVLWFYVQLGCWIVDRETIQKTQLLATLIL